MFLCIYIFIGKVPSSLCSITNLHELLVNVAGSNPLISCYASCLNTVNDYSLPSLVCPTPTQEAVCSLVNGTNIGSKSGYEAWSCTSVGTPITNLCTWHGITCASNIPDASIKIDVPITGTLPSLLGTLTMLNTLDISNSQLIGSFIISFFFVIIIEVIEIIEII